MKINIITHFNGVGLEQDANIIKSILDSKGHICNFVEYKQNKCTFADKNIFLELIRTDFFKFAKENILIPNPEWFFSEWLAKLKDVKILCKTYDALNVFSKISDNVHYIGFTSQDCFLSDVKKEDRFIHIAGKSSHKNTDVIIKAWQSGKIKDKLILIKQDYKGINNNIIHCSRMPREDLLILMNACQYHLCPSEYEGFGHYINEARSTGALIISTDAAPMNELVKNGILIKPDRFYTHHSGTMAKIDNIDKIIEATEKVKLLSEKESTKTRQDYLKEKQNFINNLLKHF